MTDLDAPTPPARVDSTTRLVLARLATGTLSLRDDTAERRAHERAAPAMPGRLELSAFGAAIVCATLIGVALPQAPAVQARPNAMPATIAVAAPIAAATAAPTEAVEKRSTPSSDAPAPSAQAASISEPAAPIVEPTAAAAPTTEDSAEGGEAAPEPDAATDDPLPDAATGRLSQVALVIVHGDAPVRWRTAPDDAPARRRAALGTTFTGFAQRPGAPLVTSLGLIAGQASNPATRSGCEAPSASTTPAPLNPGTLDADGRVAGSGCDYPAGTPSLPTAIAVDGRRWKAYVPVAEGQAAAALCGVPAGAVPEAVAGFAKAGALGHLSDLSTSGACESAASPLTQLRADLGSAEAPTWMVIEIGDCGADGCDASETAARDRDLDDTIAALTADDGLARDGAAFVVGDGSVDPTGLAAAEPGSVPAAPDDPTAPDAVATGALLLGAGVARDATDPLPLDPFSLARTQAAWLGVDPPGWAAAESATALAVPEG